MWQIKKPWPWKQSYYVIFTVSSVQVGNAKYVAHHHQAEATQNIQVIGEAELQLVLWIQCMHDKWQ